MAHAGEDILEQIRYAAASRGFVIGMEHGNSIPGKEGELALIKAYRAVDPV